MTTYEELYSNYELFVSYIKETLNDDGSAEVILPIEWSYHVYDDADRKTLGITTRIGRRQKLSTIWKKMKQPDNSLYVRTPGLLGGYSSPSTWTEQIEVFVLRYSEELHARLANARAAQAILAAANMADYQLAADDKKQNKKRLAMESMKEDEEKGYTVTPSADDACVYTVETTVTGKSGLSYKTVTIKASNSLEYNCALKIVGKNAEKMLAKNPSLNVDTEELLRSYVYKNRSGAMKLRRDYNLDSSMRQRLIAFYNDTY